MLIDPWVGERMHRSREQEWIDQAERRRMIHEADLAAPPGAIRRAAGTTLIRAGAWLAGLSGGDHDYDAWMRRRLSSST